MTTNSASEEGPEPQSHRFSSILKLTVWLLLFMLMWLSFAKKNLPAMFATPTKAGPEQLYETAPQTWENITHSPAANNTTVLLTAKKDENGNHSDVKNHTTALLSTEESRPIRPFSNYFIHIPKTGGSSAFNEFLNDTKELGHGTVCDHEWGSRGKATAENWNKWLGMKNGTCLLHTSEGYYAKDPKHQFTIIRDPVKHVLSQYFHCTESIDHKSNWHLMPSLDEWLEYWVNVGDGGGHNNFNCYVPINMQTTRVGTAATLEQRYDVVGITSELDRSTCLISISLYGKVPSRCNCTGHRRRLEIFDHGVTHHGGSYKPTQRQLEAIRNLTTKDAALYEAATEMYQRTVQDFELKYSFTLCDR